MRKAILTIDDSPTSLTPDIIAFLQKNDLKCIFFCTGTQLSRLPERADQIVQSGFIIGNHSFTHRAFSTLSLKECVEEISLTEAEIDKVYQRNSIARSSRYFRFPYGDKGDLLRTEIQEELLSKSIQNISGLNITYSWFWENSLNSDFDSFWTFDTLDCKLSDGTSDFTPQEILDHIEDNNPPMGGNLSVGNSDEIVLMHDNPKTNERFPKYYEILIQRIEQKGIKFIRRAS